MTVSPTTLYDAESDQAVLVSGTIPFGPLIEGFRGRSKHWQANEIAELLTTWGHDRGDFPSPEEPERVYELKDEVDRSIHEVDTAANAHKFEPDGYAVGLALRGKLSGFVDGLSQLRALDPFIAESEIHNEIICYNYDCEKATKSLLSQVKTAAQQNGLQPKKIRR